METEARTKDGMKAIATPGGIADTATGEHRDQEAGTRTPHGFIATGPAHHPDVECFIPASESAVAEDGQMCGLCPTGLNSTVIGRCVWLFAQKPLLARLQAATALLAVIVDRCGHGDTCVISYAEAAEVCDAHRKSVQNWMNDLVAEGLITKAVKGREGVQVTLNTGKVGTINVWATAQAALSWTEQQLGHMRAVQDALFQDSYSKLSDARKTLA